MCVNRSHWNSAVAIDSIKLKGCWLAWLLPDYIDKWQLKYCLTAHTHSHTHTRTHTHSCVMYSQRVIILFYLIWFDFPHISHAPLRFASLDLTFFYSFSTFCSWLLLLNRLSIYATPLFVFHTVLAPLAWRWLNTNTWANTNTTPTNRNKQMSPRWGSWGANKSFNMYAIKCCDMSASLS